MRLIKLYPFLLVLFLFQSCMEEAGTWKNDQIAKGKREDFHERNAEVLKNLTANDFRAMHMFLSRELNADRYTERKVEHVSNRLNDKKYVLLDEYYIVNKYIEQDTIYSKGNGINQYILDYPGTERQMYMAFFVPENSANKYMIAIVYAKYDYGWKISMLDVGPYTINGKTAPELFELAKENYKNNYLIDAVNNMALAFSCARPNDIWQYPGEVPLHDFYVKLLNEANDHYKFPFEVSAVPTKPVIIRVYNQTNDEGSFPIVYYLTKINLSDTVAVKKENELIKKEMPNIMPGIDKGKKYIFYSAFNKKPNIKTSVEHFDITEKLR